MEKPNERAAPVPRMSGEALGRFYAVHNARFDKCLHPPLTCEGQAIRAHSIQNAGALDLLAEDGHVVALSLRVTANGPEIAFKRIGRNNASTFSGLCAEHDAALFRPIDTQPLDLADTEHLFLLAYRSVTRELHAVMEAASQMRLAYESGLERRAKGSANDAAGRRFITAGIKAYETFEFRERYFDPILQSRAFDGVEHDVIELDGQKPVLAVSSLFSFLDLPRPEDFARCVLNVAPLTPTKTAVVFSYAGPDAACVRTRLARILTASGAYQRYELSRLILEHIENFVLAPSHVAAWGDERARKVVQAFHANVTRGGGVPDDADMMLF